MFSFEFYNPVRIVFGKGRIQKLAELIPEDAVLLITYGGGSIKRNGVYDQVKDALKDHKGKIIEFGGIEANPDYDTLIKAVALGKAEGVTFVLAVGGGSVADGSKFICAGIVYNGEPWEFVQDNTKVPETVIPLGVVITLPATGSEMNRGGVISWRAKKLKKPVRADALFPRFSIIDPSVTFSLPIEQMHNGICDAFVHVVEQYITYSVDAKFQDRTSEGILLTLIEGVSIECTTSIDIEAETQRLHDSPEDVNVRANIFWCATNALNYIIGSGVPNDWATHMIGHQLTALHGVTHGPSLAIVLAGLWRKRLSAKRTKLLQYARRVWGITEEDEDAAIEEAIKKTDSFFHETLGMPISLSQAGINDPAATIDAIIERLGEDCELGERGDIKADDVREILLSRV